MKIDTGPGAHFTQRTPGRRCQYSHVSHDSGYPLPGDVWELNNPTPLVALFVGPGICCRYHHPLSTEIYLPHLFVLEMMMVRHSILPRFHLSLWVYYPRCFGNINRYDMDPDGFLIVSEAVRS